MQMPNINCQYFDWGSGGKCNKLPKRFKYFRRTCVKFKSTAVCEMQEHWPKNVVPVPPPARLYKDCGGLMVRTKESIQASYEWEMKRRTK